MVCKRCLKKFFEGEKREKRRSEAKGYMYVYGQVSKKKKGWQVGKQTRADKRGQGKGCMRR